MGTRMGVVVSSVAVLAGLTTALTAYPVVGSAEEMAAGGAKMTLSMTKDYTASPWTHEVGWSNRALHKLGFGATNLLLGWTDLFTEPKEATQAGETFIRGLGYGLKDALENELGGAVHVVTFPFTGIDAPLPEGGTQILNK